MVFDSALRKAKPVEIIENGKTKHTEPDPGPYLDNARFEGNV